MFGSSLIINKYLFKEFFKKFIFLLLIFFVISFFIRILENVRLFSSKIPNFLSIFEISLLQTPRILQILLSLIVGFASISFVHSLNKKGELLTLRAAGVSIWQLFYILSFISLILGLITIGIIYPLTIKSEEKSLASQNTYNNSSYNLILKDKPEIWLKENYLNQKRILKAFKLDSNYILYSATLLIMEKDMDLQERVESEKMSLSQNFLEFENCYIYKKINDYKPYFQKKYKIETNLSLKNLNENFSQPSSITIWKLPQFIYSLTKTGASTKNYKLYLTFLILIPIKFINSSLFALIFAAGHIRDKKYTINLFFGVLTIIGYFFINETITRLSYGFSINPWLASTMPIMVIFAASLLFLIYIEEV